MPIVTPGTYSLAALTSEINADPLGLGYAAHVTAGYWQGVANLANSNPEPITAANQESIYKPQTLASDLVAGIVAAEYNALTAAARDLCALVFGTQWVKTGDANLRSLIVSIFAAGTATRTNLTNLASRTASRAEALWGAGYVVDQLQVAEALGHA